MSPRPCGFRKEWASCILPGWHSLLSIFPVAAFSLLGTFSSLLYFPVILLFSKWCSLVYSECHKCPYARTNTVIYTYIHAHILCVCQMLLALLDIGLGLPWGNIPLLQISLLFSSCDSSSRVRKNVYVALSVWCAPKKGKYQQQRQRNCTRERFDKRSFYFRRSALWLRRPEFKLLPPMSSHFF